MKNHRRSPSPRSVNSRRKSQASPNRKRSRSRSRSRSVNSRLKSQSPYNRKQNAHYVGTKYDTLDNGARPFRVVVNGKHVGVYKAEYNDNDEYFSRPVYPTLTHTFVAQKVFIGASKTGKRKGNTILLKVGSGNKYVYIGTNVKQFTTLSPIVSYFSPVGNSDVPYPYAIDKDDTYYLMNSNELVKGVKAGSDPYNFAWFTKPKPKTKKFKTTKVSR